MKRTCLVLSLALVASLAGAARGQDDRIAQERARRDLLAQKTHQLVQHYLQNARAIGRKIGREIVAGQNRGDARGGHRRRRTDLPNARMGMRRPEKTGMQLIRQIYVIDETATS